MASAMLLGPAHAGFAQAVEEAATETASQPCDGVPIFARPSCQIATGAVTAGGAFVGEAIATGADAALQAIVEWVVSGASWLLGEVIGFIDASTRPEVRQGWFAIAYRDMAAIALLIMLPLLLVSIIQAVIRQSFAHLVKAVAVYVPVAAVGMFAAVTVVDHMVLITDDLSLWIGRSTGTNLTGFARDVGTALSDVTLSAGGSATAGVALPGFAALLGAAVIGFASFVIWVLLVLRQAAIYAAVFFLPLAFAALVWPTTAHWLRRLLESLVAIIMSKFVIVAVMALASGALSAVGEEGFPVIMSGGALLLLAAFAPFVLLRLIPVFESGLAGQLDGTTNSRTSPIAGPTAGGVYRGVRQARAASAARMSASGMAGGSAALAGAGAATAGLGLVAAGAGKAGGAIKSAAAQTATVAPPSSNSNGSRNASAATAAADDKPPRGGSSGGSPTSGSSRQTGNNSGRPATGAPTHSPTQAGTPGGSPVSPSLPQVPGPPPPVQRGTTPSRPAQRPS